MADGEIMKRPDPSASLDGAGAIAASVFTRFDRGMPPDEVVTELMLPVDTVESLWRNLGSAPWRCVALGAGRASAP